MNEENQRTDTGECQNEAEGNGEVGNKCTFITTANGAQHDQAICENSSEDSQDDLRDSTANKISQDARSVLARSHRQHHQNH